MRKLWRETWDNFLNNPSWVIARVRSVVFFFAAAGLAFAHDLGEALEMPKVTKWVKVAAILSMAVAARLAAGQKNDEPVKPMVQPTVQP